MNKRQFNFLLKLVHFQSHGLTPPVSLNQNIYQVAFLAWLHHCCSAKISCQGFDSFTIKHQLRRCAWDSLYKKARFEKWFDWAGVGGGYFEWRQCHQRQSIIRVKKSFVVKPIFQVLTGSADTSEQGSSCLNLLGARNSWMTS